jgi:hypothetical protein
MMEIEDKKGYMGGLFAYVTVLVNQELLLQNEYLAAESRMLRHIRRRMDALAGTDFFTVARPPHLHSCRLAAS